VTLMEQTAALLAALNPADFQEREAYVKRGRSRRVEIGPAGESEVRSEEEGWAVRAGTDRAAFFAAGSGAPPSAFDWPEPDGRPVRLPRPAERGPWRASADLDIPLLVEGEAKGLVRAIVSRVAEELPGASVVEAVLEDGQSESGLVNHHGIEVEARHRGAALRLFATGPQSSSARIYLGERAARRFEPSRIAADVATLLSVHATGEAVERDRGEFVLAPTLGARLLAALRPLWLGRGGISLASSLRDRTGLVASPRLTLVENPRHEGAVPGAAWDGEGVPTRETLIVEEGRYVQPLLSWREASPPRLRSSGCTRRASWRDVPAPGITQLYVRPDRETRAVQLVQGVSRGYYLMDGGRPAQVDVSEDRFALPVCGYRMEGGQARGAIAKTVLCGSVRALLRGIQAVAADLEFLPLGGMVGSPTMLVTGVELKKAP
jgi:predicted Zn-dependent protease